MPQIQIQGISLDLPDHYTCGHQCTAAEAAVLNAARAENIRSNFGKRVKALLDAVKARDGRAALNATEVIELKHEFASYCASYALPAPQVRRSLDPIGRAAYHIAADLVASHLRKRGIAAASLPPGQFDARVAQVAARPEVLAEAKRRVDATASIVAEALDMEDAV